MLESCPFNLLSSFELITWITFGSSFILRVIDNLDDYKFVRTGESLIIFDLITHPDTNLTQEKLRLTNHWKKFQSLSHFETPKKMTTYI